MSSTAEEVDPFFYGKSRGTWTRRPNPTGISKRVSTSFRMNSPITFPIFHRRCLTVKNLVLKNKRPFGIYPHLVPTLRPDRVGT